MDGYVWKLDVAGRVPCTLNKVVSVARLKEADDAEPMAIVLGQRTAA